MKRCPICSGKLLPLPKEDKYACRNCKQTFTAKELVDELRKIGAL